MNVETPLFTEQFEQIRPSLPDGDAEWRQMALDRFNALGLPTQKREAWRYTPLSGLKNELPAVALNRDTLGAALKAQMIPGALHLAFIGGYFVPELSSPLGGVGGLSIANITQVLTDEAAGQGDALVNDIVLNGGENPDEALVALNGAMVTDGAVIDVAPGAQITQPIQLLYAGNPTGLVNVRHIIRLGAGSRASLVEVAQDADAQGWLNVVNQIALDDDARLDHLRIMDDGSQANHIAQTRVSLAANARYESFALLSGGALARHEVQAVFTGSGGHCGLSGIGLGQRKEIRDVITHIDHALPDCTSAQTFKNVMDGHAASVFQGKVTVQQDAQHTDAQQSNQNILLARTATANAKPELIIFADDVKCAHGATVGELDADQLFYLQARGLDPASAKQLLVEGFIADVFEIIEDEALRDHLRGIASDWLGTS
jgi:Fe-S cluster assembly protein SufD